jgi:hypothetical protein
MALIQAIASTPRTAKTKFGDKAVLDCRLESGETITIWKEANNPQLMSITNGERLVLSPIETLTRELEISRSYWHSLIREKADLSWELMKKIEEVLEIDLEVEI